MEEDPWHWTTLKVMEFFRNDAVAYLSDRPHAHLPPLEPLLESIHGNDVDGPTLLEDLDVACLRDDFGVTKLGSRSAILYCIRKLRGQSDIYKTNHSLTAERSSTLSPPKFPNPSAIEPAPLNLSPARPPFESSAPAVSVAPRRNDEQPFTNPISSNSSQKHTSSGGDPLKKRRKLDLNKLEHVSEDTNHLATASAFADTTGCLADTALTVDELFYGPTKFGQEVRELLPEETTHILNTDTSRDSSEENFQMLGCKKPFGLRRFVYQQMLYFLGSSEEKDVMRNDRGARALLPYREGLQPGERSATVFQFSSSGAEAVAIREKAECVEHLNPDTHVDQVPSAGEWNFLVEKYRSEEDHVLPEYGQSEADESLSVSSNTSNEDQAEEEAQLQSLPVSKIIDDTICETIARFNTRLTEFDAKKALTEWRKMKQSRTLRDMFIENARIHVDSLTRRLEKMKHDLQCSEWDNVASLRQICKSLEATVEDREEYRWKISVYRRRQPPEKPKGRGGFRLRPNRATPSGKHSASVHDVSMYANDRFSGSPEPAHDFEEQTEDGPVQAVEFRANDAVENGALENDEDPPGSSPPALADLSSSSPVGNDFIDEDEVTDNSLSDANGTVSGMKDQEDENSKFVDVDEANRQLHQDADSDSEHLPKITEILSARRKSAGRTSILSSTTPNMDRTVDPQTQIASPLDKKMTKNIGRNPQGLLKNPQNATASDIESWDIIALSNGGDRQRLLIKLLYTMDHPDFERLDRCFRSLNRGEIMEGLLASLHTLRNSETTATENGVNESLSVCARIYLTWISASPQFFDWAATPHTRAPTPPLSESGWLSAYSRIQLNLFIPMLDLYLKKRQTSMFLKPNKESKRSHAEVIVVSSDDEAVKGDISDVEQQDTPHKKRKRKVLENARGKKARELAQARTSRFAEGTNANVLAAMIESGGDIGDVEINPVREKDQEGIFICSKISRKLKAHQIDGIRFLWREITSTSEEGGSGCILAHTMGLGKTMQTIALLVAVSETLQSDNRQVYSQLPLHLRPRGALRGQRHPRILILCPPSLIENWEREIDIWAPGRLWRVTIIDAYNRPAYVSLVEQWMERGGVLLLGYQMFRSLVTERKSQVDRKNQFGPDPDRVFLENHLLRGPEVVVADEAHYLKNADSGLGKAASRIRTKARIALTGTPMSNDVQEVYALVSWVAPGYLGDPVEFRAHYAEPIKEGLYGDSTQQERRKSQMKLKVLHHEIEPKVHRANIEVLRGALKPKVEFVIMVPLTEVQIKLYRKFLRLIRVEKMEKVSSMRIFGLLALLTLLCNHPQCFRRKLLSPPPKTIAKPNTQPNMQALIEDEGVEQDRDIGFESTRGLSVTASAGKAPDTIGDEPVSSLGIDKAMIDELVKEYDDFDDSDPALSPKVTIFATLLQYCLNCKDKVLVFSSSIPTLQYLDELLRTKGLKFGRIDGQTKFNQRNLLLKAFHQDEFDIMLVSTRAGGLGLNIQGANRVFIFDFGFNPTWEEQAIGRSYRLGQLKPVFVYRFVAGGTFEKNIYNRQLFKSSLAQRVVDKKNPRRNAERNVHELLVEPEELSQENITEYMEKDPQVLAKLIEMHGRPAGDGKFDTMIREIKTMETLQADAPEDPLNADELQQVDDEIKTGRVMRRRRGLGSATTDAALI